MRTEKKRTPWNKGLKLPFKPRPNAVGRKVWNKGLAIGDVCWRHRNRPSRLLRNCLNCGLSITTLPCQNQKFCSKSCCCKYHSHPSRNKNIGRKLSDQHRLNLSISHIGRVTGDRHYNWKGGKTKARKKEMVKYEYLMWRGLVFERDNYTCQSCGAHGIYLMAHHKKSWADHPHLRYDLSNGISLCKKCHAESDPHFARFCGKKGPIICTI